MPETIGPATLSWHGAAVEIDVPGDGWSAVLDALRGIGLACAAMQRPHGGGTVRTRLPEGVDADGLRGLVRSALGVPEEAPPAEEAGQAPGPRKGHWRKGRSRNLSPELVQIARRTLDLLATALRRGWRHPTLGVLSTRVVGDHLGVEHSTVARWAKGQRLPPLEHLERMAELLREYRP